MIRFALPIAALAAGVVSLSLTHAARAQAPGAPQPVTVTKVWARATPPRAETGAVYMTLTSPTGDTLTGASTPVAATATVHEMTMADGIMRMRPVAGGLKLPPGQAVTLQPNGYHVMLEGLKGPLKQGTDIPVHLVFQTAPPLDVVAHVEAIGASGPGTSPAAGMTMPPGMTMSK